MERDLRHHWQRETFRIGEQVISTRWHCAFCPTPGPIAPDRPSDALCHARVEVAMVATWNEAIEASVKVCEAREDHRAELSNRARPSDITMSLAHDEAAREAATCADKIRALRRLS